MKILVQAFSVLAFGMSASACTPRYIGESALPDQETAILDLAQSDPGVNFVLIRPPNGENVYFQNVGSPKLHLETGYWDIAAWCDVRFHDVIPTARIWVRAGRRYSFDCKTDGVHARLVEIR